MGPAVRPYLFALVATDSDARSLKGASGIPRWFSVLRGRASGGGPARCPTNPRYATEQQEVTVSRTSRSVTRTVAPTPRAMLFMSRARKSRIRRCAAIAVALLALVSACSGPSGTATSTSTAPSTAATPTSPGDVPSIPVTSKVVFQSGGRIQVASPGASPRALAPSVPGDQQHPDWSPDGTSVAFETDFATVWVAPLDGGEARKVFTCSGTCASVQDAAWSPDGRTIAFMTATTQDGSTTDTSTITLLDVASGASRVAYADRSHKVWLFHPRWSGDGSALVFEEDTFASSQLTEESVAQRRLGIVASSGGEPRFLGGDGTEPDWSTTRDLIAYSKDDNIYVVRADGSGARKVTTFDGKGRHAIQPTFTPDGRSITFTLVTGTFGVDDLPSAAVIGEDGSGLARLEGLTRATHPRMSP